MQDLMNGGDLRFHISRKTMTEDAVRFWMAELACALRYIHKQGIVHRDLKPDNVLLDSEGHVHLADFVRIISLHDCVDQKTDLCVECGFRLPQRPQTAQQVRNTGVSGSRGVWRQGIPERSGLVVIGRDLLRVHLQQGMTADSIRDPI